MMRLRVFCRVAGRSERRLRAADLSPALELHLAKYRKLVPTLALINHLVDEDSGPIGEAAIVRALAFSQYLETHARRAYGAGTEAEDGGGESDTGPHSQGRSCLTDSRRETSIRKAGLTFPTGDRCKPASTY